MAKPSSPSYSDLGLPDGHGFPERFTLDTRQCEAVARRDQLVPPDHYRVAWLSELFSVSEDGRTLFCTAALQREGPIDYCLSELSIGDLRLAAITRLDAVFA